MSVCGRMAYIVNICALCFLQLSERVRFLCPDSERRIFVLDETTSSRKRVCGMIPPKQKEREVISYLFMFVFSQKEKFWNDVHLTLVPGSLRSLGFGRKLERLLMFSLYAPIV